MRVDEMEYQQVQLFELTDRQQRQIDRLTNDTFPQGQTFLLDGKKVIAILNTDLRWFEAQNADEIASGKVKKVVC